MKATLIIVQNDADHAEAKKLVEKLMGANDSASRALDRSGEADRGL
jgi:hypothetical protein